MSITRNQIDTAPDSRDSYVYDLVKEGLAFDLLQAAGRQTQGPDLGQLLSLPAIRSILRERSDIKRIPRVIGLIALGSPNQWGDRFEIEVEYDDRGHRAVYASSGLRGSRWQCYMD